MPDPARAAAGSTGGVLALDIGGTKTSAALVRDGAAGEVLTVPTPAQEGPAAILAAALDLAEAASGDASPLAVGIASAGVVDTARGRITHATDALRGWAGTEVAAAVSSRLGLPVAVLNDVHAHGLGEALHGAGRDASSMLLLAVGTGIGGCQVIGGEVVTGARGAAGHLGHLPVPEAEGIPCPCGRSGHLEGLASGPGILALARRLGAAGSDGTPVADGRALAALAVADPEGPEARAYTIAGRATGRVLGGALNLLDTDLVVLTGGVSAAHGMSGDGEPWRRALDAGLAKEAMDVVAATPIVPARAGQHAALLGAAAHASAHAL